ncbi:MAG: cadherin-like beta sandwich domain-containing protein [Verrucomicrobiaceae bacterium]|nr:cadherin-like beta sandwich domain-containing protein [Verrucomicrobiaceae bacterium]
MNNKFLRPILALCGLISGLTLPVAQAQTFEVLFSDSTAYSPWNGLVKGSDGNLYGTTPQGGVSDLGTVYKVTPTGVITTVVSFDLSNGARPFCNLVEGADGSYYGTTREGGMNGAGTVFKVSPAGGLTVLTHFLSSEGYPNEGLVIGSDGNFYGVTSRGGPASRGSLFKLTPGGTRTTVAFMTSESGYPGAIVQGSDGNFYLPSSGGSEGKGAIVKITPAGSVTVMASFNGSNGRNPSHQLLEGSDGHFYGTTLDGGVSDAGTVFRISPTGTLTSLASFGGAFVGDEPQGLFEGPDGAFYGVTKRGGNSNSGTIFKITDSGTLTILASFMTNLGQGQFPVGRLALADDGHLYGVSQFSVDGTSGSVFKASTAGVLTTVAEFNNLAGRQDASLVRASDGNFYGTARIGGAQDSGTAFKVDTSGTFSLIATFGGVSGKWPSSQIIEGNDGHFYGTTMTGGAHGAGTVFKLTPSGTLTTLHSFNVTDGRHPATGLVTDSAGSFYGTTREGGTANHGTVFKVSPSGTPTMLHSFVGVDGSKPDTQLVVGMDGNLYGTTPEGGSSGFGTIFMITPTGTFTSLHSFSGANGRMPNAVLLKGTDGSLYGTTFYGGSYGKGSVFRLSSGGAFAVLHSFNGVGGDGPSGGLLEGSDGSVYGTTQFGGSSPGAGNGTVFKLTASGVFTSLVSFSGGNGKRPLSGLVEGFGGNLFGTTSEGGGQGLGTVFKVSPSGAFASLHSFNGSHASLPSGGLVFDSSHRLYGTAGSMTVWRIDPTSPPTVVTIDSSNIKSNSVSVQGSVNPNGLTTTAQFEYGITAALGTASSVLISPADGTLAQAVSLQLTGLSPDTTYYYRVSGSNSLGTTSGDIKTFHTLQTDADLSALSLSVSPISPAFVGTLTAYGATVSSAVTHTSVSATTVLPGATLTINGTPVSSGTPSPSISLSIGSNVITVRVTAEDAVTTKDYVITVVRLGDPVNTTLHSKGGAVPNAGVVGSGIPAGAIWSKLGVPCINDAGHLAVLGDWVAGTVRGSSIFRGGPGAVTLQISLSKGAPVPGLTNVVLGTLKDPILGPDGSIAVVAGLANAPSTTGAVTTADNSALVLDADGSGAGGAVVIARKGTAAPGAGGALWKTFDSVAVGNNAVAILGKLSGGTITTLNDQCLWIYNRNTMTTTLALREGNTLLGSTVKVIGALVARAAAGAQGRGVANDGTQDQVAVRVTLANGTVAVGAVAEDGSVAWSYQTGGVAPGYVGATWKSFTMPGQNTVSAQAFVGVVQGGNATTATNTSIFTEDDSSFALSKRVTKGDAAPGFPGGVFGGFKDPVLGTGGAFAFVGSTMVSSSAGIASTSNDGVWHHDGSTLSLIARESTHPAGTTTGTNWKAFTSVALPNGRKPLFYATLVVGPGGVTTGSDTGIWAVDSLGQVKKLIQEGDAFGSSTVKSFKALLPLTGSPAQTRSFNNNGEVVMQVTDAAGGTHLLHVAVP